MRRSILTWMLFAAVWIAIGISPLTGDVSAQAREPTDDEVNAIAKKLYCPVCENVPLDVCPTQACKDWREDIRSKLAAGWTEPEIINYFVEQHGAQVLPAPPLEGLNLLAYLLPPAAFIVGAVVLFRVIRSWRSSPPLEEPAPSVSPEEARYIARLEEELRQRQ